MIFVAVTGLGSQSDATEARPLWRPGDPFWWYGAAPPDLPAGAIWSRVLGAVGRHTLSADDMYDSWDGPACEPPSVPDPPMVYSLLPPDLVADLHSCTLIHPLPDAYVPTTPPARVFLTVTDRKNLIIYNGVPLNTFLMQMFEQKPTSPVYPNIYTMARSPEFTEQVWFVKSDISNCYWSCRLPPSHFNMFWFILSDGTRWAFSVLPFGYAGACSVVQRKTASTAGRAVQLAKCPVPTPPQSFIMLDDCLVWHPLYNVARRTAHLYRQLLRDAGFVVVEGAQKNPTEPTRSVLFVGKIWSYSPNRPLVANCLPARLDDVACALLSLPEAAPVRLLQKVLGCYCWAAAPVNMVLSFASRLYASLNSAISAGRAYAPVSFGDIDLALRGLELLSDSANTPTPTMAYATDPVVLQVRKAASQGVLHAVHGHLLVFVDFAEVSGIAAILEVMPNGQVWCTQFQPTANRRHADCDQQSGELAGLTNGIFVAARSRGSARRLVFADNVGAIHTSASWCGRTSSRAYWLRRLAAGLVALSEDSATRSPVIAHLCGADMPADYYTRMEMLYPTRTLIGSVKVPLWLVWP